MLVKLAHIVCSHGVCIRADHFSEGAAAGPFGPQNAPWLSLGAWVGYPGYLAD
jgi:hypothetical protein